MACATRIVYSCIVDTHPKFRNQARIIIATLLSVGVLPDDIIIHVAPDVPAETREAVAAMGVCIMELKPIAIGGGYFNKIAQLQMLGSVKASTYVLCDTDLAFLESLSAYAGSSVTWAKPVDAENPPLERLEAMRMRAGIRATPRIALTTSKRLPTYATNCNGGVYILPRRTLLKLFLPWQEYARLASMAQDLLGRYVVSADQIGFALAMLYLEEDVAELPVELNFSATSGHWSHMTTIRPLVLHHHQDGDELGLLRPTGYPLVDEAIAEINRRVMAFASRRAGDRSALPKATPKDDAA